AAAWAGWWTLLDIVLHKLNVAVIEINKFTLLVILGMLAGVGYALGQPLGNVLRRTGALNRAPWLLSLLFVVVAGIAGEIGYVAVHLLRLVGFFALRAAVRLLGPIVAGYSAFWVFVKLVLLGAIWFFCGNRASERAVVRLHV